mmetsp:Transcript_21571/g.62488  ORF Transcript_21571/g.62488 Transcript_21571/m.62488 type:complete len:207 (+) Transcript_21571:90-710(+)
MDASVLRLPAGWVVPANPGPARVVAIGAACEFPRPGGGPRCARAAGPQAVRLMTPSWAALATGAVAAAACRAGPGARGRGGPWPSRRSMRETVARRALELPVKEPPVKTTVAIPGANLKEETKQKRADQYRLLLFNDPLNKREFVARCLMTICLLKEGDSYQVMMKAHKEGVAVIGTYQFETAEAYCEGLKAKGLSVDIIPVDKDE